MWLCGVFFNMGLFSDKCKGKKTIIIWLNFNGFFINEFILCEYLFNLTILKSFYHSSNGSIRVPSLIRALTVELYLVNKHKL